MFEFMCPSGSSSLFVVFFLDLGVKREMQSTAYQCSRTHIILFHQLESLVVSVMLISKESVSGFYYGKQTQPKKSNPEA